MTDEQLSGLFADGTAPERDVVFAQRVGTQIAHKRRGFRHFALSARALVISMLAAAVFMTIWALEPVLGQIAESSPQFMGVPAPLILGVLAVGLAVHALRFVRFRIG